MSMKSTAAITILAAAMFVGDHTTASPLLAGAAAVLVPMLHGVGCILFQMTAGTNTR